MTIPIVVLGRRTGAGVAAYAAYAHRWRSGYALFTGALVTLSGYALMQWASGGWAWFYMFELPRRHYLVKKHLATFFGHDLLLPLGITCLLVAAYAVARVRRAEFDRLAFYGCMLASLAGGAFVSRLNVGSYDNVAWPMYACLAVLFGAACHWLVSEADAQAPRAWAIAGLALGVVQFLGLVYAPGSHMPSAGDRLAGEVVYRYLGAPDLRVGDNPFEAKGDFRAQNVSVGLRYKLG